MITSKELRSKWIRYYEERGHLNIGAVSLIGDGTTGVMFNVAGMQPLMPYLLGAKHPSGQTKLCNVQGCVRTIDIESVGDPTHFTFFEMMGNWSLGDYFKKEKTRWSYDFLTKELGLDGEKLCSTVFEGNEAAPRDDETAELLKQVGIKPEHIFYLPKEDNWWELEGTVDTPCGPDNEWFYPRHDTPCGPDCGPTCGCGRYVEVGNDVYMQYKKTADGYEPLANKNVDTGFGLDRLLAFLNGVTDGYKTDLFLPVIHYLEEKSGKKYDEDEQARKAIRIIADHMRTSTMLIGDVNGIVPQNSGAGYILRRLLRRAMRYARQLELDMSILADVCKIYIEQVYGEAYPLLVEKRDYICKVVSMEADRFAKTIDSGLVRLNDMIQTLKAEGKTELSGEDAFRLYDTYGFPVDLTMEILGEQGLTLDRTAFDADMEAQRERARSARERQSDLGWVESGNTFAAKLKSEFTGYEKEQDTAKILAIAVDGESADSIGNGMRGVMILDQTPFYAESGGQVADHGTIRANGAVFRVTDVQKTPDGEILHTGEMVEGGMSVGDDVTAEICSVRRAAIRRAHSAAHLLQAALRRVLGNHVEQAGSLVEPDRVRFDFTHFAAMTAEEIAKTEALVNETILAGIPGNTQEMPVDEAKKLGAMALFGEKYGATVRVVRFGDFSLELCGGTHLDNTAKVGLFKITGEASVAAGVRRIEAVTGKAVLDLLATREGEIADAAQALKTTAADLPRRAAQVSEELRAQSREIELLSGKLARVDAERMLGTAETVGSVKLIASVVEGQTAAGLRTICDMLRDLDESVVAVLGAVADGKVVFAACAGKSAVKAGAHAGNLLKAAAKVCGGGGGGRPDSATAGGRDVDKLPQAIAETAETLRGMLK